MTMIAIRSNNMSLFYTRIVVVLLLVLPSVSAFSGPLSSIHNRQIAQTLTTLPTATFSNRIGSSSTRTNSSTRLHLFSSSSAKKAAKTGFPKKILAAITAVMAKIFKDLQSLSTSQRLLFVGIFCFGALMGRSFREPFWKRITDMQDVPSSFINADTNQARPLVGTAVTVSDGDTFRFLHRPTPFSPKALAKGEKASVIALPIRICSMDTPETAKFGKKGQPFGEEAKEELKKLLLGQNVVVRLLQRDQYGRGVGHVTVKPNPVLPPVPVDEHMLKAGLAEVYQGGGAVYGPLGLDGYLELEEEARKKKIGIWSQKNRESAAEFKKKNK